MATPIAEDNQGFKSADIALSIGVVTVLLVMMLPLPRFLVDIFLAFSSVSYTHLTLPTTPYV